VDRVGALDTLEIQVEVDDQYFSDEIVQLEALSKKIRHAVESVLGVSVKIKLVEHKTIQRSEGKAQRIIDKRKLL
jgi:phenylacetate-CoA ligase